MAFQVTNTSSSKNWVFIHENHFLLNTAFHSFSFIPPKKYSEIYPPFQHTTKQKEGKKTEGTNKGTKKCVYFFASDLKNIIFHSYMYKWCQFQFSPASLRCKEEQKKKSMDLNSKQPNAKESICCLRPPACFKKQYQPKVI